MIISIILVTKMDLLLHKLHWDSFPFKPNPPKEKRIKIQDKVFFQICICDQLS